jgi:hypothetical protein
MFEFMDKLLGQVRPRLVAAASRFTPCTGVGSLLEAVERTAEIAVPGDVVLLPPACSGRDRFQNHDGRSAAFGDAGGRRAAQGSERSSGPRADRGGFGNPILERLNTD